MARNQRITRLKVVHQTFQLIEENRPLKKPKYFDYQLPGGLKIRKYNSNIFGFNPSEYCVKAQKIFAIKLINI